MREKKRLGRACIAPLKTCLAAITTSAVLGLAVPSSAGDDGTGKIEVRNPPERCGNAVAIIRAKYTPPTDAEGHQVNISAEERPIEELLAPGLFIRYVVDYDGLFYGISRKDIEREGCTLEQLREVGIVNLGQIVQGDLRYLDLGHSYMAMFDGNYESSLLLLDFLWEDKMAFMAPNGFVVGVPSRDVLFVCDRNSVEGLEEVKRGMRGVFESPEAGHLISPYLYARVDDKWVVFDTNEDLFK